MRVLVTGGAGFIGAHVCRELLEWGHVPVVVDRLVPQVHGRDVSVAVRASREALGPEVELHRKDVRDPGALRIALDGCDAVVHLAARVGVGQSMYAVREYASENCAGTGSLLDALSEYRDRASKLVVASSMSCYGEGLYRCASCMRRHRPPHRPRARTSAGLWEVPCPSCSGDLESVPTTEDVPLAPSSPYAVTKRDQEELCLTWGRAFGVPTTALRFFNVYGPGQSLSNPYTGAAAIFAAQVMNGWAPRVFEDGLQTRDLVHVSDVARAVAHALGPARADGLAVNVGTGIPTTVLELAVAVVRAVRGGDVVEADVPGLFREGDVRHCIASTDLARKELGFVARVRPEEGIRDLSVWLAEQPIPKDLTDTATRELAVEGLLFLALSTDVKVL